MVSGFESAGDIAEAVNSGTLHPVEVTDGYLDRIQRRGGETNSFVTVIEDEARRRAEEVAESVEDENLPLAGVPVAIKDLSDTKSGVRNTMGLEALSEEVADETTETVRRLEEAGAVVVGTTNTPELGHRVRTDNGVVGPTSTPFDPDGEVNAGGSSGGSAAALADGLCALATGSDVGGSLRNPASCCGVISMKPSHGVVPRGNQVNGFRGHTPVGVHGPMARSVDDLALMLDVVAGRDGVDPFSIPKQERYSGISAPDPSQLSLAYSPDLDVFAVDPSVRDALGSLVSELESSGAAVDRVSLDLPEFGALTYSYSLMVTTFFATAVGEIEERHGFDLLEDHAETLPQSLVTLVRQGRSNDVMSYTEADFVRTELYREVEEVVTGYDGLLCPTLATPPLTHDEPIPTEIDGESTNGLPTSWMLSWIFNLTGHPVVNLPAGKADGLPVGAQLVGEIYEEGAVLGTASAIESVALEGWSYPDG